MKRNVLCIILAAFSFFSFTGCDSSTITGDNFSTNHAASVDMNAEPIDFESFQLEIFNSMAGAMVYDAVKNDSGVHVSYYYEYEGWVSDDDEYENMRQVACEFDGGQDLYDSLALLLGQCRVLSWDGFHESDPNVLDGGGFSFRAELSEQNEIEAHGSNAYPSCYGYFEKNISDWIRTAPISSTHFSGPYFSLELPESWVDQVKVRFDPGLAVFYLPAEETDITLLVLHTEFGGYYSGDDSVKAGVLYPQEDSIADFNEEESVSISDSGNSGLSSFNEDDFVFFSYVCKSDFSSFDEIMTDEQKAISSGLASDVDIIMKSLTPAMGYVFHEEDGSVLYESAADRLMEDARSVWLNSFLGGEYGRSTSTEIDGKNYRPYSASYEVSKVKNTDELLQIFLQYFSADFAERVIQQAVDDKIFVTQDGLLYVECREIENPVYGAYYLEDIIIEEDGNYTLIYTVQKSLPSDEKYSYSGSEDVSFHVKRNEDGAFVFTDFPYWDK